MKEVIAAMIVPVGAMIFVIYSIAKQGRRNANNNENDRNLFI